MSALVDALIRRNIVPGRLGRYVLYEFLRSLGLAACVFTGFFMLMTSMKFESQAEAYGTNVTTMVKTLPYFLPYLMLFAVPMSFLVAGVLSFGKLEGSGEISAMRAAGTRLTTVLAAPLAVALLATVPMLVLANSGIDWGFGRARDVIVASGRASLTHRADTGKTLSVGAGSRSYRIHRFPPGPGGESAIAIVEFEDGAPRELVMARDHDLEIAGDESRGEDAMDIFRFRLSGGDTAPDGKGWARVFRPGEVLLASEGRLELAFESITRGRSSFGTREYASGLSGNVRVAGEITRSLETLELKQADAAAELAADLVAGGTPSAATEQRLEAATYRCGAARAELAEAVEDLRVYEMEIHRKLSMAFSPLAMALFGIALGLRLGRGSRVVGFTVGIAAIAVVYYPLWISGQGLAASGVLPPGLAVWAAPALIGTGGAVWLSRMV